MTNPSVKSKLEASKENKEKLLEGIIKNRDEYLKIDAKFKKEIDKHIDITLNNRCNPCKWFRV